MLRLAPRFFTALRLRTSQATRLLAAPIHWWRGCVRPHTHRRPAARLMYLRQRQSIRPGLESLEEREMLDANYALMDALAQSRNDAMASAAALVRVVQPSPTNTPTVANDSDSDGDGLTGAIVSLPSHGNVTFDSDGSFSYMPNVGYTGSDSFQYTASDGVLTSAPTTVTINVTNTAPTAVNQTYGIPENSSVNVTAASGLLKGASDADGDSLTASLVAGSGPSHGTATVNSDGSFSYTPATGYTGSDSFQYAASDGAASTDATVTLNIHADSSAPTAGPTSYSVQHDQTLTETAAQGVLTYASDSDGDPLTASLVSGPSNGTLTLNPDGSFTYTPKAGWTGTDTFQYDTSDGANTSAAATVTINVTNTGAPVANAHSYSIERNNEFKADASIGVLANDSDSDGDILTAVLLSNPSDGTLNFSSDGSFDYTPNTNFTGTDTFTYDASDGVSTSAPATVTLTVNASPPQANNDAYAVLQNTTLNVSSSSGALANDYDPDNLPLTAQLVTQPSDGSLTLSSDGSFTYTPNSNFTGTDSFTYKASDGSLTSTPATVTITVFTSNSPPTTESQQYTVSHIGDLNISGPGVLNGASDPNGQPLTAVLDSDVQDGYLILNPDGSFEYAPDWNFVGNDSFTYHATDGLANSASTTVTIHVTDQAPVLTTPVPSFNVTEDGSLSENQPALLSGAYDADGDALMATLVSGTSNGTLSLQADGTFTYEPNTSFIGTDSFTYEITDGLFNSSPITVSIQVQPGSPFELDGRDAGPGTTWMSDTEAASEGIYVSASDPNPAALLAHATGNPNYQRIINWDPTQLSITEGSGGSGGSSGSLTLNESDGNVQLTIVPVRAFAPGETATISMAVQDTQTNQQVAFLNVKAVQQKVQVTQLSFTSDEGLMRVGGAGKTPNNLRYALADRSNSQNGGVGGKGGLNAFEATVVYKYKDPKGNTKTAYFPAGTGDELVWDSADKILYVFRTLVVFNNLANPPIVVTELARYTTNDTDRPPNMKLP